MENKNAITMSEITLQSIELPNGEILGYRTSGTGDKIIVLLHGNMTSSKHWDIFMENMPSDYRLYAVDLRGFGISTYHHPINSLKDLADDLEEFVEALDLQKFMLIGWSTGGGVAMQFASQHPQLVKSLVLLESVDIKGYPMFKKDAFGKHVYGELLESKEEIANDPVQVKPILEAYERKDKNFLKTIWDFSIYTHQKPSPERYEAYLDDMLTQRNLVDIDYSLVNFNISHQHNGITQGTGEVDAITMPTLVLQGDRDLVVPQKMGESIAQGIGQNAELVILQNCGHSPMIDCLPKLIELITDFYQKVETEIVEEIHDFSGIEMIDRVFTHLKKDVVIDQRGIYRYEDLINHSARFASALLKIKPDWKNQPVAFLVPANFDYVACLWGIWRAGGVAVPIAVAHPKAEIQYILENTGAEVLIVHEDFTEKLTEIITQKSVQILKVEDIYSEYIAEVPKVDEDRAALILYTSGTTSKPKGAIHTHKSIKAQVKMLIEAWEWTSKDIILNVLPLHHVHGVVNVLSCCLWAGATCEMLTKFDPEVVCTYMIHDHPTIFMAVPTIYHKLIDYWEKCPLEEQLQISKACAKMRLMISGSAALPATILEKWYKISHHILLERYGMTEVGMILSNSLHGKRHIGLVGKTLPHVFVRLVDEQGKVITETETQGEIQVKSPGVFAGYWKDEEFTKKAFQDEWFKTGDIAVQNDHGDFKIIGRHNVDIIKTGGHKVSAIEVEGVLLANPAIDECAVVGLEDEEWGQKIAVAVVVEEGQVFDETTIKNWAKDKLTNYKIPSVWLIVQSLPHNAMNKIVKSKVKELFVSEKAK